MTIAELLHWLNCRIVRALDTDDVTELRRLIETRNRWMQALRLTDEPEMSEEAA